MELALNRATSKHHFNNILKSQKKGIRIMIRLYTKELLVILRLYVLEPERYVKDSDIKETRP